ncbi:helix-hairpin-helix domain-containing protein [Parabacteroides sp. 52]|uniref:helix-hairpin-helix domain-containing protein n=1 Tax=unclassified Parabacteroides TaxID=2649774 RepID=UPI0013D6DF0B|nr:MULTISPECIES: helix-hairpin-helix domain-containing protein [unclassified Parabacteroides]MDH6534764.1 hypothetical protein [Parabacteroides sp. PM5-20]NDV55770.1 helix-hairpin-helix domain-containing protein [Parabacteroides sp. 52]
MKRIMISLSVFLLFHTGFLAGQGHLSSDKWIEYIEELMQETEDTQRIETLYNDLSYLTDHPFELNHVNREELRRLPFLTDRQIESILTYRAKYGKMVTIYELKNIEELDFQTIDLLLPFIYIGKTAVDNLPFTVNNLLKYGRNELQIRYDQCFQQKKGYRPQADSILEQYPNRKYLGEPFYHSVRYSYLFDNRLQIGFTGEKDAGEPFWNKHHKGYDYYSAHFFLKDMQWLKSLAIGDYKVSFGQGLVISNDFTPSRSAIVAQAERRNNGFRRHFSTNETDFFRGAAATVNIDKVDISLFYSYRKMDAKVENDVFTSFKTDGIHRLVRDKEKRHTVPVQTFGGNIRYLSPDLCIGLTALTYSFGNYRIEPEDKPYNLFYFRGNKNINLGIDYLFKRKGFKIYGETALSENKALATLNALQLTPTSYISFLFLQRYYNRKYQAFYGNAFSQNNNSPQNEQGIYMGLQVVPLPYWKISAYADIFRFPWLKYGIDAPSSGKEYMGQIDYTRNKNFTAYIRYKYKKKEKNVKEEGHSVLILPYTQQRMRIQFVYGYQPAFLFKTSIDAVSFSEEKKDQPAKGIMLAQSAGWKSSSFPLQADIYIAWFHTDDSNSRISSYEKNILYAFYMPSFYGKGIRLAATFRWDITDRLTLFAKIGHTRYNDRDILGTDLEEIEGKEKTDFNGNLRWKF